MPVSGSPRTLTTTSSPVLYLQRRSSIAQVITAEESVGKAFTQHIRKGKYPFQEIDLKDVDAL